jgi:hypothetical protein
MQGGGLAGLFFRAPQDQHERRKRGDDKRQDCEPFGLSLHCSWRAVRQTFMMVA